jgi:NAD(P)-dependent dehydrogenase (short-subunit alcohol dehydrogenase family)
MSMLLPLKPGGFKPPASLSETELAAIALLHALVVGGTNGIGKALVVSLLKRQARVTIVGRSAPSDILDNEGFKSHVRFVGADLSTVKNSRETARGLKEEKYDLIVFTQGIFLNQLERTSEGVERNFAVSYLSRYIMMQEFLSDGWLENMKLESGKKPRVFIMGSPGTKTKGNLDDINSELSYAFGPAHMMNVICNEALTITLARKHPSINIYGLNPGFVSTGIRSEALTATNKFLKWIVEGFVSVACPTPEMYAERALIKLMASPALEDGSVSGTAFNQNGEEILQNPWLSDANIEKAMTETAKMLTRLNLE